MSTNPNTGKVIISFDDTDYLPDYFASPSMDVKRGLTITELLVKMWSDRECREAIETDACFLYINGVFTTRDKWPSTKVNDKDKIVILANKLPEKAEPIKISSHAGKSISMWWFRKNTKEDPNDYTIRVNGLKVEADYVLKLDDQVIVRKVLEQ